MDALARASWRGLTGVLSVAEVRENGLLKGVREDSPHFCSISSLDASAQLLPPSHESLVQFGLRVIQIDSAQLWVPRDIGVARSKNAPDIQPCARRLHRITCLFWI